LEDTYSGEKLAIQGGFYVYNIQSQDLQYLARFEGYDAPQALFSPNGNWLALPSITVNGFAFFRTSDLLALPPLAAPTLFPTFTPVPTYTPTPVETPTSAQ
jgi:hypothetical protein